MQATDQKTTVLTAKTLMDEPVRNRQGEKVGKVEDYMLDLQSGCVQYAVMSFGGFLGMGEKLFAVPWNSMMLDTENRCFILDVDRDSLKDAPGFDKGNWPMAEQNDYRSSVDTYWGRRAGSGYNDPYGGGASGMGSTGSSSGGTGY